MVLQPLSNADRLAAAATCTRMLADALQPLSWKHAQLVRVAATQLTRHATLPAVHSPLQLAPIDLLLDIARLSPQLLDGVRYLYNLTAYSHPAGRQLVPLLQHPVAQ